MKNQLSTLAIILFCTYAVNLIGQHAVSQEIHGLKVSGIQFRPFEVLTLESVDVHSRNYNLEGLKQGVVMSFNQEVIDALLKNRNEYVQIPLATSERDALVLTLKRNEIFTSDFAAYASSDPNNPIDYAPGVHYKGIVDGEESSVVAISVFKDEVMGMIATDQGNFVLGQIKNDPENRHIFYNDKDLDMPLGFECGTPDDGPGYTKEQLSSQSGSRDQGDCIRVYIEINDDIVVEEGSATNAINLITSVFNQSFTLYANEGINMSISEILAWTTPSPYSGSSSDQWLTSYQNNTGPFDGDLSHLVSFQTSGGIAASASGICNSNPDLSKCFSGFWSGYIVVPTYSWQVNVVTHEMGHLIGSRHTHACVWNFNNTAIDGCAGQTEGNCPLPGNPPEGGTIMSYCHLVTGIFINFNLGFGTQPGNVIRNTVNTLGNCLSSSCNPPTPAYCWSEGGGYQPGHAGWIQSVVLGSINNNSGNNLGYGDFTGQSTTLNAGSAYTITMTAGNEGNNWSKKWTVWIDLNHDLDWDDAGEQIATGSGSLGVNFTFTVPASSPSVTTRMRVAMKRSDQPAPLLSCGIAASGEVEDYTIVVDAAGGPTCADGAQNGDETGVDCGGTNCPVCPTCSDGVQNGDETGVDCGGSCTACPGTILFGHYFETGWDGWIDGGDDANRYAGTNSWEGTYSINLQDNSAEQSAMTSPPVNLTGVDSVRLEFYFYATSMENGEDFLVSYYDGSTYTTVETYICGYGGHFANNSFWVASVIVKSSQVTFVSNARFRIQCDASDNNDDIYIDAVTLTAYYGIPPCADADNDGVCDSQDVCPGFDDNLIGSACDDGDECTENDVYLGAPDCNCAGTPIPDCVPCNAQTASLTPNPLTHIGTGVSSTNILTLPTGSSDVEYTISGLNSKITGNANGRFIDRVKVWYDSGSGAQLYGTFNGDQQSTVNILMAGPIQSIWVTLEDGYDGNSAVTQSISFSLVTHCTPPQAFIQEDEENAFIKIETRSVVSVLLGDALQVYPNPVSDMLQIDYRGTIDEIRIISAHGLVIHSFEPDEDFRELSLEQIPSGLYVLMIRSGGSWVTKKFIKM